MTRIYLNPVLLGLAKENAGLHKVAFIPAGQDPTAGGGQPPADPSQAGAPPGGAPGMPPGDPSMGGAPPPGGDPAAGGAPPGGAPGGAPGGSLPNELVGLITQTIQQQLAMGGGAGGAAGGGPKKSKGGDETAMQMYKMNVFLMAIITGLNKSGCTIEIPPEAMLGPPPGSDPAMAAQQGLAVQPGQPGVAQPGAAGQDPAAAGQDPNAQPQQQPMNFMPALAPKTAVDVDDLALEDAMLAMGMPISKTAVHEGPIPQAMRELFGTDPAEAAPPASAVTITQKASAVMEIIAATRRKTRTSQ